MKYAPPPHQRTGPPRPTAEKRHLLIVVALLAAQAGLLFSTALDKSDAWDEGHSLGSGAQLWVHHIFNTDTPPIPAIGFALALGVGGRNLSDVPSHPRRLGVDYMRGVLEPGGGCTLPDLQQNLLACRTISIVATLIGGFFLWLAATRFGIATAHFTLVLWCFSPTVLAHGCLATADIWVASMLCVALWTAVRYAEHPTKSALVALGLALVAAGLCKFTAFGIWPVAALFVIGVWSARGASGRSLGGARFAGGILAAALAALAVAAAADTLGFTDGPSVWMRQLQVQFRAGFLDGHWVPVYAAGQSSLDGFWWFYLACIAFKTTLGAQGLAVARLATTASRPRWKRVRVDILLLLYPVLLLVVMSLGKKQLGIRYLLPAFPFALLWLGRAFDDLRTRFGRTGAIATAALTLAAVADSVFIHPHHLMYFNQWAGGPENGPQWLIDSCDWGQDKKRLAEWQRREGIDELFYTKFGDNGPVWGVVYFAPPCEPTPGVYALQAFPVHVPYANEGCVDWLTLEPPDQRIGYSIYIYRVDESRIERLAQKRAAGAAPFAATGS